MAKKKCFYCVLDRFLFNSVSSSSHFTECFPAATLGEQLVGTNTATHRREARRKFSGIFADIFVIKIRVWRLRLQLSVKLA